MPSVATDFPALGVNRFEVAPSVPSYPFAKNGDYTTYLRTRSYKQKLANYTPGSRGVDTDPADATAYLLEETDVVSDPYGTLVRFDRLFGTIPTDQVTYPGSRYFTKPEYTAPVASNPFDIGAISEGLTTRWSDWSNVGGQASFTPTNGIFTAGDAKVYFPVKVPTAQTPGYASGGTYTLTYGADTTGAINYNDNEGSISAALNGLASIISAGITATCTITYMTNTNTGGGIDISLSGGSDAARLIPITMNAASLTVNTSKNPTTAVVSANNQQIKLPFHFTITGHGLNASLDLAACWNVPTTFILPVGYWGVIDANTLWIPPYGNNTFSISVLGTYSYTYTPTSTPVVYTAGIRLVRTRVTEYYYLPGVSSGITTPADIPVPLGLQNPDDFLDALLTPLAGWQVYESSGPMFWMNGPIYVVFVTEINFDDLV